jgi:cardiolipin synthase
LPRYELLVGSGDFWARAEADIAQANRRVLVQAMTFEGDAAGLAVADAIGTSFASDRRVLVDDYSRHNLNDSFLAFSNDAALQAEAISTWDMFDRLVAQGAGVRVTNPVGRNPLRFPARNHKKLLVMDNVAWIGGINFSDHNYDWHDIMLRIEDPAVTEWLAQEFEADWIGKPAYRRAQFGDELGLLSLGGVGNQAAYREVLDLFARARGSIEMLSAYPTMPFTDEMARAAARGVKVTLHTPRPNNKPIVRDYLLGFAPKVGIELRLIDYMTHVKAALIDGEILLIGSSNFDFISYHLQNEFVALLRDRELIADVVARLLEPAREQGVQPRPEEMRGWAPRKAAVSLNFANALFSKLKHGRRVMEWKRPD